MIDVDNLPREELLILEKKIKSNLNKSHKQELQRVYKEIVRVCKDNGFTLDEVLEQGKQTKLPAKYKDKNSDKTWSGYGKQPNWIKEHLAKNKSLDDLLIK